MVAWAPPFKFIIMFTEHRLLRKVPVPSEVIDDLGSHLPYKSEVKGVNIQKSPVGLDAIQHAKEMVVMVQEEDPKAILNHPVLGPILRPYERIIFAERMSPVTEDYSMGLSNNRISIPVQNMGSLEVIHIIQGVSLDENTDGDEFHLPRKMRSTTASLRDVLGDLDHTKQDSIAIFLDGTVLRHDNATHAVRALGRGLGNNTYNDGLYKSDIADRSIDGRLSRTDTAILADAKANGWPVPEGTNPNPEAEFAALARAIDAKEYILPQEQSVQRHTRGAIKNVYLINDLDPAEHEAKISPMLAAFEEGDMLSRVQSMCKFLAECPHNILNCEVFVRVLNKLNELVRDRGNETEIEIYGPEIDGLKINGSLHGFGKKLEVLEAVHQGAEEVGPFVVRIKYRHPDAKGMPVQIIAGKSLMFDNGGEQGKHEHAKEMQGDMMGGASVASEFARFGEEKPVANIDFVLGIAANKADGKSRSMEDTFTHPSGVTIEEHNTDAEGREVLGDTIWLATRLAREEGLEISQVAGIATLTGAALLIGSHRTLVISQDKQLRRKLEDMGIANGDRVQPEGLQIEDKKVMQATDRADLKNVDERRKRGAQSAAAYIRKAAELRTVPYLHFDIAPALTPDSFGTPKDMRGQFTAEGYFATLHQQVLDVAKEAVEKKAKADEWDQPLPPV